MILPSQTATAPRNGTGTRRAFSVATAPTAQRQGVATPKAALRRTTPGEPWEALGTWFQPTIGW